MKAFVIGLCLVAFALGAPSDSSLTDPQWEEFKGKHKKNFLSATNELQRYANFKNSSKFVDDLNKKFSLGKVSFEVELNEYSDIAPDDFFATKLGYNKGASKGRFLAAAAKTTVTTTKKTTTTTTKKTKTTTTKKATTTTTKKPTTTTTKKITTTTPKTSTTTKKITTTATVGATLNYTAQGYVTPVKNQGQCGSCWTFSATGALEGQYFKLTGQLVSLSEQNLVDCDFYDGGCNGGAMQYAFQYVKDSNGIATEANYPYTAKDGTCKYQSSMASGVKVQNYIDIQPTEAALKQNLETIGPISVAIDASHQSFQLYKTGVYNEPACSSTSLDHGVLLVGYGTENGQDYWLVKNSWGTGWGEKGYIKMARNQNNKCGIASDASYPVLAPMMG